MKTPSVVFKLKHLCIASCLLLLTSCATDSTTMASNGNSQENWLNQPSRFTADYAARLPQTLATNGKKTIVVDPNAHVWGAYAADGHLVRAGIATAGAPVCPPDAVGESDCRTNSGTFHITNMRGEDCASKKYPRPNGGGLMPYCMYFNNGQALHGSPDNIVAEANLSHGCVRMRIPDAQWVQTNFAQVGTKVVVLPYN